MIDDAIPLMSAHPSLDGILQDFGVSSALLRHVLQCSRIIPRRRRGKQLGSSPRNLNISTIKKCSPDIIGFQEVESGIRDAAATLTDYETEPGLYTPGEKYHRVPIYWKRDRFELRASGGFYLSETPDEWSLSWGSTSSAR
ncbi:MAG: hypothetical protein U0703_11860 [Anaerolineae bacterium]